MFNSGYGYGSGMAIGVIGLIFMLAVLILSIVLHCTVFRDENEGKYRGFAGGLYNFFTFRSLWIEGILRVIYMLLAGYFLIMALMSLFSGGIAGFFAMIIMEIPLRLVFELLLLAVVQVKHVISINKKLGKMSKDQNPSAPADPLEEEIIFEQIKTPEQPATPVAPATPVTPVTPVAPVTPEQPVAPTVTEQPVEAAAPQVEETVTQTEEVVAPQPQSDVIFCEECGSKMNINQTFCTKCGTKLNKE